REVPAALAHLGPNAKAALPVLIDVVKQGRGDDDILMALVQIDPEGKECVPALTAALKSDDEDTVEVAGSCLGLLGPRAAEAVPALVPVVARDRQDRFSDSYGAAASADRKSVV